MSDPWTPEERAREIEVLLGYGHDQRTAEELVDLRQRLEELEARGLLGGQPPRTADNGDSGDDEPPAPPLGETADEQPAATAETTDDEPASVEAAEAEPPVGEPPASKTLDERIAEAEAAGDWELHGQLQMQWLLDPNRRR